MTLRQVSKWLALVVVVTLVGFAAFRFGRSHAPRTTKPATATQPATNATANAPQKGTSAIQRIRATIGP